MTEIKDKRDYAIRKGKVLEKFSEQFYKRNENNPLYQDAIQLLMRDADPYEIIEKVLDINAELYQKLNEIMPFISPNYELWKQKTQMP